jgi:hypothetical protein
VNELTGAAEAQTDQANATALPPPQKPPLTLTATEAAFLSATYDTLIPADKLPPSVADCGLVTYFDRQLGGGSAKLAAAAPSSRASPSRLSALAHPASSSRPASFIASGQPQTIIVFECRDAHSGAEMGPIPAAVLRGRRSRDLLR